MPRDSSRRRPHAATKSGLALLALFYLNDLAALVMAALGTDAVLHPRLLAVWTHDSLRRAQCVMRPMFAAACFGMATFWIWHNYSRTIFDFKFSIWFSITKLNLKSKI